MYLGCTLASGDFNIGDIFVLYFALMSSYDFPPPYRDTFLSFSFSKIILALPGLSFGELLCVFIMFLNILLCC